MSPQHKQEPLKVLGHSFPRPGRQGAKSVRDAKYSQTEMYSVEAQGWGWGWLLSTRLSLRRGQARHSTLLAGPELTLLSTAMAMADWPKLTTTHPNLALR